MRVDRGSGGGNEALPALVLLGAILAFLTAQCAVLVDHKDIAGYAYGALAHGLIYFAAVIIVIRRPGGIGTLAVILIGALVFRALAMTALPNLTSDALRYVWDGRLGWEGISPYLYVPADERLAHLRDQEIYPGINQKERAVTIYPPIAQWIFMAGVAIEDGIGGMKAMMLLFEAVTIAALIGWMRAEGMPASRVVIYAWNPLPLWEFASQAHIDSAATAFLALGIWAAMCRRQGLTGALFAFAALVKYFPVVLLPALWRRWDWRLPVALFATAGLLYLPYLGQAGSGVFGFLGTHLGNEGYRAGWGFHVIWYLRDFNLADPPGWLYVSAALAIIFGIAAWSVFGRGRDEFRPERLVLLGAAFVFLTSPHYPWYFGFLCALAVRYPHPALVAMTILCIPLHIPRGDGLSWTELYTLAYVVPLVVWAVWEAGIRLFPGMAALDKRLLCPIGINSRL
ncbi:MAG: DUF2029 domain-containing protein [Alphaproteobacteria bacterium]|nr:DUF2029 domain-containing protein [Alphaproteobacteria bacterium]